MSPRACLALIWVLGCGAPPTPPPQPSPPPVPAADGNARLDRRVVPTAYQLDLRIDPAANTVKGTSEIRITLAEPSTRIVLHAQGLDLAPPTVRSAGQTQTGVIVPGENGAITLVFETPVRAGSATLSFAWTGSLGAKPEGLYRVKEGDDWYAFTQFQPLAARTVFPCFDQPEFKTPYRTRLTVRAGQFGLSNSRETDRTDADGWATYTFAETAPLPTYLVAFAVGPFDIAAAPPDALGDVPLRVVTTRGKGVLAKYALERTPLIHTALLRYFGRPHGFDKLDLVAVPNFAAGAMENVGLVTFREALLLLDGEKAPPRRRMWAQIVIAHELAHMWFGNLVTLAWWDDLWLNEAFATWMATRVVAEVDPGLEVGLEQVSNARWVMNLDSTVDARAIRQPIAHGGDINNAFDGITYGKGAAVLRMVEAWLGDAAFQKGVQAYMGRHAGGSAVTADLLSALDAASGKDVTGLLATFLDQPGVPLVTARVDCAAKQLELSQTRYLPADSAAKRDARWQVPVCVRLGTGEGSTIRCERLSDATQRFPLETCPAWIHPNADNRGYYLWRLIDQKGPVDLRAAFAKAKLSDAERAALPGLLWAMVDANALPVATFLDMHGLLLTDPHRVVVEGALAGLARIDAIAVDDAARPAWGAWLRARLKPHFDRLGTIDRSDDTTADRLLRRRIVSALVHLGQDASLEAQAREVARRFLADPASVPQAQVSRALPIAAAKGDAVLWTALRDALTAEPAPIIRAAVVQALASFDDPALYAKTLGLLLDGTLRAQDFRSVLRGADRHTRAAAWTWMTTNYAAIVERIGQSVATRLPFVAAGACTVAERDAAAAFFADPAHAPEGTAKNLGVVLEGISACVRLRAATQAPLRAWLTARQ